MLETARIDVARHVLAAFRAAVPEARGVMLATEQGRAVAHDLDASEATAVAHEAIHRHRFDLAALADAPRRPVSALVPRPTGPVLVVFVPPWLFRDAEPWAEPVNQAA